MPIAPEPEVELDYIERLLRRFWRRREGGADRTRPEVELDYIERLLRRF